MESKIYGSMENIAMLFMIALILQRAIYHVVYACAENSDQWTTPVFICLVSYPKKLELSLQFDLIMS